MHQSLQSSIAVLFFSRSAAQEASAKQWLSRQGDQGNKLIAKSLIQNSLQVLEKAGLPVYQIDESSQRGRTFGERIANAFQDVFDKGYRGVIAVGNDTPDLDQVNWGAVREALEQGFCVLGPNLRGGTYLIGLTADHFQKTGFERLPWKTSRVFEALKQSLEVPGAAGVLILSAFRDCNTLQDLLQMARGRLAQPWLLAILICLLRVQYSRAHLLPIRPLRHVYLPAALRAPPQ